MKALFWATPKEPAATPFINHQNVLFRGCRDQHAGAGFEFRPAFCGVQAVWGCQAGKKPDVTACSHPSPIRSASQGSRAEKNPIRRDGGALRFRHQVEFVRPFAALFPPQQFARLGRAAGLSRSGNSLRITPISRWGVSARYTRENRWLTPKRLIQNAEHFPRTLLICIPFASITPLGGGRCRFSLQAETKRVFCRSQSVTRGNCS